MHFPLSNSRTEAPLYPSPKDQTPGLLSFCEEISWIPQEYKLEQSSKVQSGDQSLC